MVSWQDAIVKVMEGRHGPVKLRDLYDAVLRVKKTDLDEKSIKHRVRAALNDLRKEGRVENVAEGLWELNR